MIETKFQHSFFYKYLSLNILLFSIIFISYVGLLNNAYAVDQQKALEKEQQIFTKLRQASQKNDPALAESLAKKIPNFPFPLFVEYYQIKPLMFDRAHRALVNVPDQRILKFLSDYKDTPVADQLRNDYLLVLGKRGDWKEFDRLYAQLVYRNNIQVKCYELQSRLIKGQDIKNEAFQLLDTPQQYTEGCVSLITELAKQNVISDREVWRYIRLAYSLNFLTLGNEIAQQALSVLPDNFQIATKNPRTYLSNYSIHDEPSQQLALLSIILVARDNPIEASFILKKIQHNLRRNLRAVAWAEVAYKGMIVLIPNAQEWYAYSKDAQNLSQQVYEWRVRSGLLFQNWPMVKWSIEQMPEFLRNEERWIYWYARAESALGHENKAKELYKSIASQRSFYGVLALEALGKKIEDLPAYKPSAQEVDKLASVKEFVIAKRMFDMDLRPEGNRVWSWGLRNMNDKQLMAAAAYAQKLGIIDRMIFTANRSKTLNNYALTFPMPHRDIVEGYAKKANLDMAWGYGLIRQESRFISTAKSIAGARGLMQLMPATADEVAKKLNIYPLKKQHLHSVDINIMLGIYYLKEVYNRFGNSVLLASAGYNAGPRRAFRWQATLPQVVEGAIFSETITFNETRIYTQNVLFNTAIYSMLDGRPQSLTALLGKIEPNLD